MTHLPPVQIVAVVGGSGAGKGWLVERLCRVLGDKACHLQLDDFYRDRSHLPMRRRSKLNFDTPEAIDWESAERVLRACRAGQPTVVPRYDFATHCRLPCLNRWQPRPLLLVDGLWLLRPPSVRQLFDLKVFLDTPAELRRTRRIERDSAQRGYTVPDIEHRLRTAVMPMHERYVEPQRKWADVILKQPFAEADAVTLADRLWPLLERASLLPPWMHETLRADLVSHLTQHEYCN